MKKKYLRITLTMLWSLLIMTAFANAENVTTIQYAFWGNPTAIGVEKDIIDEFEKANPSIKVQPIAVDFNNYNTKLLTMIAGGQAPDVMRVNDYDFSDFLNAKALKDITRLVKTDKIELSKYYRAGLDDCMNKNRYYGLPWGTAPIYVFINLKLFKNAGIPIPSPNWKYADFIKIAKQLSKGTGAERQYGFGFTASTIEHLFPLLWTGGGDIFDKTRKKFTLDQPAAYKKIQEVADLIKAGVFADPAQFSSPEVVDRWMANNKLAMRINSAAGIISMQKIEGLEFDALPFPGTAKNPRVTTYKSNIIAISASTKKEKAAWTFLKFLRAPGGRGEMLYMQAKRIPPTVNDPELWKIFSDPTKSPKHVAEVTQLIAKSYAHLLPLRSGWMEITGELLPQLQRIYTGQMSAEHGMKEIAPKIQAIMNRTNH
jgi:multiple sugar transport system substrate-binding protein